MVTRCVEDPRLLSHLTKCLLLCNLQNNNLCFIALEVKKSNAGLRRDLHLVKAFLLSRAGKQNDKTMCV